MLELRDISRSYGGQQALEDVSFEVAEGEIVALLGPSGSGKSTLLNIVSGLESADRGEVLWKGKNLEQVSPHKRGFGLMFQDYALFPHRDVGGNVGFGLEMAGLDVEARGERVGEVLTLVGMRDFEQRDVGNLSGGEQQRVALARALAPQPRLLMLDEPLGSLDRGLRERLLTDLEGILRASGQTSLYVTHDQEEAFAIADRIVLLREGRVAQIGRPEELYRKPASIFVARFLGLSNLIGAEVRKKKGHKQAHTSLGAFVLPDGVPQGPATLLLRPDRIHLGDEGRVRLDAKVLARHFRGNTSLIEVESAEERLRFEIRTSDALPEVGKIIQISFDPEEALQVVADG